MTRSKKGPCYNMVCNLALFLVSMTWSKKRAMSQTWFYLFWRIHCEQFARLVRECSHGGEPWYNKGSFHVDLFLEQVISRALFAWLFFWTKNGSSSWVFLNFFQVSQGGESFSELVQVSHNGEPYDKNMVRIRTCGMRNLANTLPALRTPLSWILTRKKDLLH